MSKRPADSGESDESDESSGNEQTPSYKKQRFTSELAQMKDTLDTMMQSAKEHHEEARITAIDNASEVEELWTEVVTEREEMNTELATVSSEYNTACEYLNKYESSTTLAMLNKASECQFKDVQILVEDNEKINDTLTKLRNLKQCLFDKQKLAVETVEVLQKKCTGLKDKLDSIEQQVENISSLVS